MLICVSRQDRRLDHIQGGLALSCAQTRLRRRTLTWAKELFKHDCIWGAILEDGGRFEERAFS
jgi:hypothetical protein